MKPEKALRLSKVVIVIAVCLFAIEVIANYFLPITIIRVSFDNQWRTYINFMHALGLGLFCFGVGAWGMYQECQNKKK